MDAVFLSRLQFALTAGFHFIFPPLTFGLTLLIFLLETINLKKQDDVYQKLSSLLVKILGLVFVMGTATGIVLEFSFGTNWSRYSRLVGDIFGAPLAAEGIFSFFLESVFIGVLLFARNKVSRKVYWLSSFLVFFGAHLSGFWIIIANSWMQTPSGFDKVIHDGKIVKVIMNSFYDAVFNPSTVIRYIHVVLAGWITGSLFAAGIAAWYLLKGRFVNYAGPLLRIALTLFIISAALQLGSGHSHSVQVAKTQPEKMAAFEALWNTQEGAPLALFGIPVESQQKTYLEISLPKMLSFLAFMDFNAKVQGLNEFKPDERPSVLIPYASYHIMISLGFFFFGVAGIALLLLLKKTIYEARWFLWSLILLVPLPHLANESGWIAAEVGRQPWSVYKILKTAEASSVVVPAWQILTTIILFCLIYLLLFAVFMKIFLKFLDKGPENIGEEGY